MTDSAELPDKPIDKDAFDAILKRLIASPPLPLKDVPPKRKRPENAQTKTGRK